MRPAFRCRSSSASSRAAGSPSPAPRQQARSGSPLRVVRPGSGCSAAWPWGLPCHGGRRPCPAVPGDRLATSACTAGAASGAFRQAHRAHGRRHGLCRAGRGNADRVRHPRRRRAAGRRCPRRTGHGPCRDPAALRHPTPRRGPDVTDTQFRSFIDRVVTPRFPEGLTVQEGRGQWRDSNGVIERERSYELILLYPASEARPRDSQIERIRAAYEKAYAQESVARLDERTLADFGAPDARRPLSVPCSASPAQQPGEPVRPACDDRQQSQACVGRTSSHDGHTGRRHTVSAPAGSAPGDGAWPPRPTWPWWRAPPRRAPPRRRTGPIPPRPTPVSRSWTPPVHS